MLLHSRYPPYFNPRTPAECDPTCSPYSPGTGDFNPRTPAECDDHFQLRTPGSAQFQSTHSCGVRLKDAINPRIEIEISIHALLRSATSQSTTVKRHQQFQSRTPAECDVAYSTSTNALSHFNPRTPAECDEISPFCFSLFMQFQSTHSCGVRQKVKKDPEEVWDFNPRTPAECDVNIDYIPQSRLISIHALLRSATA